MRFKWTVVRLGLVAMLALLLQAIPAFAQGQASLAGYVSDPSGSMIPGAQVTVINDATGVSRKVQSDAQGHYFVSPLDPGTYTVTSAAKGFQSTRQTGVVISVATQQSLNLKMTVGSNSETVTVAADAAHVQTETGQVSYTISGKQVQDIAVNGRNFVSLAVLVPGASSDLPGEPGVGVTGGVPIRFNGVRSGGNLWTIDGSADQDVGSQNSLNTYPAIDAIDEFTTLTSNYSAAYGNAGGSVIAMALKSGTNQFHGSAYEYLRNDALDARNSFLSHKSPLKQNDFGFTLGGPIRKNKDFFFFSEEIRRIRQGTTVSTLTPTAAEEGGDFSAWAATKGKALSSASLPASLQNCVMNNGTGIDPNCINPNALALIKAGVFPASNTTTAKWGQNNYNASPSLPSNFHEELFRIDHHFSDSMTLMGHYIHDSFDQTPATSLWSGDSFPTVTNTIITPGHNLVLDLTKIVSPTIVNDLNFAFTEDNISIVNDGLYQRPSGFTVQELYPGNVQNRIPDLNFNGGYGSYQVGPRPWYNNNAVYTWSDKVTQTVGRNTFQYGGDFQYQIKNQDTSANTQGGYSFNGSFTGNSFADYLLGLPSSYSEANAQLKGLYRYEQVEGFVQDDFKASPRLTLNLGVRWFLIPHLYDKYNQLSNFVPADYNPALAPQLDANGHIVPGTGNLMNGLVIAGTNGLPRTLTQTYYNNWAPRLGFSWDPFGTGTTVVRGGYSVGYYRVQGNDTYGITSNPPFAKSVTLSNNPVSASFFDNPAGGASSPLAPPNLSTLNLQYKVPMIQQYSLTLQHQFAGDIIASLGYVGSHGTHLERQLEGNQPMPFPANGVTYDFNPALNGAGGPGVGGNTPSTNLYRPYLGWGSMSETATDASSEYNSLQVSAQKQMTKNLSFQVAYTWSKSMDNSSDFGGAHPQSSYNRAAEWGLSSFDRPQILQINYIYDLPFYRGQQGLAGEALGGWELAGITTMESGEPLTVGLSEAGTGLATRPNITGAISYPKTVAAWFNPSVFSLPAAGMFGNAGRDILRGPGLQTWNLSLYKNFKVGERVNTQLRFEFFNIFNHTNYTRVSTGLGSGNFGQVTASADPRILQAGLHISF